MGGSVQVQSEVGKGTTFSIIFSSKCTLVAEDFKIPSIKLSNDNSFDFKRSMFSQPRLMESNDRR